MTSVTVAGILYQCTAKTARGNHDLLRQNGLMQLYGSRKKAEMLSPPSDGTDETLGLLFDVIEHIVAFELCGDVQLILDPQQLVVLGYPVGPAE